MQSQIQCPVCTLYLHVGMNLQQHLDTHPKDQVIQALVNMAFAQQRNNDADAADGAIEMQCTQYAPLPADDDLRDDSMTAENVRLGSRLNERLLNGASTAPDEQTPVRRRLVPPPSYGESVRAIYDAGREPEIVCGGAAAAAAFDASVPVEQPDDLFVDAVDDAQPQAEDVAAPPNQRPRNKICILSEVKFNAQPMVVIPMYDEEPGRTLRPLGIDASASEYLDGASIVPTRSLAPIPVRKSESLDDVRSLVVVASSSDASTNADSTAGCSTGSRVSATTTTTTTTASTSTSSSSSSSSSSSTRSGQAPKVLTVKFKKPFLPVIDDDDAAQMQAPLIHGHGSFADRLNGDGELAAAAAAFEHGSSPSTSSERLALAGPSTAGGSRAMPRRRTSFLGVMADVERINQQHSQRAIGLLSDNDDTRSNDVQSWLKKPSNDELPAGGEAQKHETRNGEATDSDDEDYAAFAAAANIVIPEMPRMESMLSNGPSLQSVAATSGQCDSDYASLGPAHEEGPGAGRPEADTLDSYPDETTTSESTGDRLASDPDGDEARDANETVLNYSTKDTSSSGVRSMREEAYLSDSDDAIDRPDDKPMLFGQSIGPVDDDDDDVKANVCSTTVDLSLSFQRTRQSSVGMVESFGLASVSPPHYESSESLNIRTDEQMPAKGEISEQESNGDVDGSYNQQQVYSQNSAMDFPSCSFDTTVARESWSLAEMQPINLHYGPSESAAPDQQCWTSDYPNASSSLLGDLSALSPSSSAAQSPGTGSSLCIVPTSMPGDNLMSTLVFLTTDHAGPSTSYAPMSAASSPLPSDVATFMSAIAAGSRTDGPASMPLMSSSSAEEQAFAKPMAPPPAHRVPTGQPRHRCTVCPLAFRTIRAKCEHLAEAHLVSPLAEQVVGHSSSSAAAAASGDLGAVQRVVKLRYRCTMCPLAFSAFKYKCDHLLSAHNVTLKPRIRAGLADSGRGPCQPQSANVHNVPTVLSSPSNCITATHRFSDPSPSCSHATEDTKSGIVCAASPPEYASNGDQPAAGGQENRTKLLRYRCPQCQMAFSSFKMKCTHLLAVHNVTLEARTRTYRTFVDSSNASRDIDITTGQLSIDPLANVVVDVKTERVADDAETRRTVTTVPTKRKPLSPHTAKVKSSARPIRMHQMTNYLLNKNWDALKERLADPLIIQRAAIGFPTIDAQWPLACSVCSMRFRTIRTYDEHLKTHPAECFICSRTFQRWVNLSVHLKRHLNIREYACGECSKRFVCRQALAEHRNMHTGDTPLVCSMCPLRFRRLSNLIQHRKRFHQNIRPPQKDFICPCGEVFRTEAKLAWHSEIHDKQPKCCPFCRQRFVHRSSLGCHIRLSHPQLYLRYSQQHGGMAMLLRTPAPSGSRYVRTVPEMVECPECEQMVRKPSLKNHMRTHALAKRALLGAVSEAAPDGDGDPAAAAAAEPAKPPQQQQPPIEVHVCPICHKELSTKWNLKQHKWTHVNDSSKPFRCTLCPKGFLRDNELDAHMNLHRSIRRYTCDYCGLQFHNKYNWVRHTREHETAKQHRCDECDKSFHRRYYLTEHKRSHTGERPYECVICGKTSTTKANHNKHVRIHHARDPLAAEA